MVRYPFRVGNSTEGQPPSAVQAERQLGNLQRLGSKANASSVVTSRAPRL